MSTIIQSIEQAQLREVPVFKAGDTVRVHFKVIEGTRQRVQVFEGIVIARKRAGLNETFTVRKISYGVGVERVFPDHSPNIDKIEVLQRGKVPMDLSKVERALSQTDLPAKARTYGMATASADGMDVMAVEEAAAAGVKMPITPLSPRLITML